MRISISDLKELATKRGLTHIAVYGWDGKEQHIASYGNTVEACSQVADWANKLKQALGWPESLMAQPSRVKKLQQRIKELESELAKYKNDGQSIHDKEIQSKLDKLGKIVLEKSNRVDITIEEDKKIMVGLADQMHEECLEKQPITYSDMFEQIAKGSKND